MDLTGKRFENSEGKNNTEKVLDLAEKKIVEGNDSESNLLTFPLKAIRSQLIKTWKK